jgi:hypothetical protein
MEEELKLAGKEFAKSQWNILENGISELDLLLIV